MAEPNKLYLNMGKIPMGWVHANIRRHAFEILKLLNNPNAPVSDVVEILLLLNGFMDRNGLPTETTLKVAEEHRKNRDRFSATVKAVVSERGL
jgi:hypothetical protein